MRVTNLLLISAVCFLMAPAGWAQAASSQVKPGILGFLDPSTGTFRIIPSVEEEEAPPATVFGGTINLTITITIKSASINTVTCTASTTVLDGTTSPKILTETNTVGGTGTSTRTCTLSIPYSWSLSNQSTDNMSTSYTVIGTTGTTGLPQRSSGVNPFDVRKVPSNGTTTTLTAAVTI